MRLSNIVGIGLLVVAVGLLVTGIGAAFAGEDVSEPQATAAQENVNAGGVIASADLSVEVLGLKVERSIDADPPTTRESALPDLNVRRQQNVAPEAVPVKADLALDVATGGAAQRSSTTPGSMETASVETTAIGTPAMLTLAAAAFAGAGLLALLWGSLKTLGHKLVVFPVVALYAKISRSEVFENEVREQIFHAIRATPGIAATDLARAAQVSWGTTIYHLEVLEQTRMVTSVREGRHRRYFLNGAPLEQSKHAISVLHNAVTADVAERIRAAPGLTQKDLASATGMSPQALHWHLVRLMGAGLIRKERDGRMVRHFPATASAS